MIARAPVPHVTHPKIVHAQKLGVVGRTLAPLITPFMLLWAVMAVLASRLFLNSPGVNVTSRAAIAPDGPPTDTGVWFVGGQAEKGPTNTWALLHNMTDFDAVYGDRFTPLPTLYDSVDTFFRDGGRQAYVIRVVGPGATKGTLTSVDRAGTPVPTIAVDALSEGAYSSEISREVVNGVGANTFALIIRSEGAIVEQSGDLANPAAAVAWAANSKFVRVRDLASASAAPTNNPAVSPATALSAGTDDRTSITDVHRTAALDKFTADLGPGQVSWPGATTTAIGNALQAHAQLRNRTAILDSPDTGVAGDMIATVANILLSPEPERCAVFGPQAIVPGLTPGTIRTVPMSAVVAGIMARNDAVNGTGTPAAGQNGQSRYAIDVTHTYSDADRKAANDAGVNIVKPLYGPITIYGYRTCSADLRWRSLADQRLRMEIANLAGIIGEEYVFQKIDPQGHTIAGYGGALKAMLTRFYNQGSLFGLTPDDAFSVNVGDSVNTILTKAAGELHAVLGLKMSPFAEMVFIEIVKVPITEPL